MLLPPAEQDSVEKVLVVTIHLRIQIRTDGRKQGDNPLSEPRSLGPDGKQCEFDTRGLLQRAHIIANWPPIYIGKESDRHWEEGEDLSLLEFKAIQYRRKGNAVATEEQLVRIAKVPKREFMRRGINQHTLEKICRRESVRATKLAKCLTALEEYVRHTVTQF